MTKKDITIPADNIKNLEIDQNAGENPYFEPAYALALENDIKLHGQIDPIIMYNNVVMDGRNRINAIMKLGLDLKALELSDCTYDEAVAFARSKNDHRRHMTPSQIAMRAAKEIWQSRFNEDATKKPRPQWLKVHEHRDVADKKISITTVEAAIRISKYHPKYAEEIFTGQRSIQQVESILKKSKNTESFITAQAEAFHKEVNDDTFHYENGEIKPRNLVYVDKTLSYLETEYSEDTAIRYTKYTKEHTIEELAKMLVELEEQLDEAKGK